MQLDTPAPDEYEPGLQLVQVVEPVWLPYVPTPHWLHTASPSWLL